MKLTVLAIVVLALSPALSRGEPLDGLVRDYFLASKKSDRTRLEKQILADKSLTPARLARAIRGAPLWEKRPAGKHEITLQLRRGKASRRSAWVNVPAGYDPARKWPLIITMHGQGATAESMLDQTLFFLGSRREEFIVVAPERIGAEDDDDSGVIGFTFPAHLAGRPRQWVEALRRHYRLDNDRVLLMGYSLGGQNAWLGGLMQPDLFAGVMPLATPLQVVGNDLLYEDLLQNLANTYVLFVWGAKDNVDAEGKPLLDGGNAAWAKRMTAVMRAVGNTRFDAAELADVGHLGVVPPPQLLTKFLDQQRERWPARVRHTFRLAEQSEAYWISADRLQGVPLSDGTIQVEMQDGETEASATRRHLVSRLGLVEGAVRIGPGTGTGGPEKSGGAAGPENTGAAGGREKTGGAGSGEKAGAAGEKQEIRLNSRRAVRIVLLLSDDLLNLDRPVTILRGRKQVYAGRVRRDMRVTLREAARTWDFDRLASARVVVPVAGKVKFGYPAAKQK